jgi:hypothetical protein
MEYKMLSGGDSGGHAVKKGVKLRVRPAPKARAKKKRVQLKVEQQWGPVYLNAKEFAELQSCIQKPQRPTQSILEGAEQIRRLYQRSR